MSLSSLFFVQVALLFDFYEDPRALERYQYDNANVSNLLTHIIIYRPHIRTATQINPNSTQFTTPPTKHKAQQPTMPHPPTIDTTHPMPPAPPHPTTQHHSPTNAPPTTNHPTPPSSPDPDPDPDLRALISPTLLSYHHARSTGLIPPQNWPRDSPSLVALDTLIARRTVAKLPTPMRTPDWDCGFWSRDGTIVRGACGTLETCAGADASANAERERGVVGRRPRLWLNPPKRPGEGVGVRVRLRLNPPRKVGAGGGVSKERRSRRDAIVRMRPACR